MKLVILDRDGTIGQEWDEHADGEQDWQPLPGALEAIARLNHSGWHVVIAAGFIATQGVSQGLFQQIGERFGVDLYGIPAVGDSVDDAIAAAACGCEPHLVLTGQGAQYRGRALLSSFPSATRVHEDLAAFAEFLIDRELPAQPAESP